MHICIYVGMHVYIVNSARASNGRHITPKTLQVCLFSVPSLEVYGLDAERLYASYFGGDEELPGS